MLGDASANAAGAAQGGPSDFLFDAFASYGSRPDRELVRDVEAFLESLHRNTLVEPDFRRKLELFVDGSDLNPSRTPRRDVDAIDPIFDLLVEHLKRSRRFVLFVGPESHDNDWIKAELDWWLDHRDIIIVLTHGQTPSNDTERSATFPARIVELGLDKRLWFDLRGRRRRTRTAPVRPYTEERLRLAAALFEPPISKNDLIKSWTHGIRRRRRRNIAMASALALLGLIAFDAVDSRQRLSQSIDVAQRHIRDHDFEQAMRIAVAGLPVDYDFSWRPGWSNPNVRKLLASLAGATQRSAYIELKTCKNGPKRKAECTPPAESANATRSARPEVDAPDALPIRSVAFDPSGSKLVTASSQGFVTVWNIGADKGAVTCHQNDFFPEETRRMLRPGDGGTPWVRDARFGPDGRTVLAAGTHGAWIWNLDHPGCGHGANVIRMAGKHTADVRSAAFSPDWGTVVTTSDDDTARLWNAANGEPRGPLLLPPSRFPGRSYITSAEFSPDGGSIAVSRTDGLIAIVDSKSLQVRDSPLQSIGPIVWTVRFDRDGERIVSASENGEVAIWNVSTGARTPLPRHPTAVFGASFSPDGRSVATVSMDRTVQIWHATKLVQVAIFKGHQGPVLSAAFSPDGSRIATSSDDATARIWDTGPSIIPSAEPVSPDALTSSAMSIDGMSLVTGGLDGWVSVYGVGRDNTLIKGARLNPGVGTITGVAFLEAAKTVVFASKTGTVALWDTQTADHKPFPNLPGKSLPTEKTFVAANPRGDQIAIASSAPGPVDHNRLWRRETGVSVALEGAEGITGIEFSRDGIKVVAASEAASAGKRLAFIWDAKTGKKHRWLEHDAEVKSAHFSDDGSRVVTAALDFNARVWNPSTGKELRRFEGHIFDINAARFSPEGERIVTASSDRTVRVWEVQSATPMIQFALAIDGNDAFFSRDGKSIFVVTEDGEIVTRDVSWTRRIDKELKFRACKERLRGIDEHDACSRRGPLSIPYWAGLSCGWWKALRPQAGSGATQWYEYASGLLRCSY